MSIWKTRYDEMVATCAQTGRERDEARAEVTRLINLVADIRAAVGDPTGTLMQDDLVERCRHLVISRDEARKERDEARRIAADLFAVLDELGCGMKPLPWEDDK